MIQIGAYEAKTHLSGLLEKVCQGEHIIITKHNIPVAKIVPADSQKIRSVADTIGQLRKFRKGRKAGGVGLKAMIEKGRR